MSNLSLLILTAVLFALALFSPSSLFGWRARSLVKRVTMDQPTSSSQQKLINSQEGQKIADLFRKANQEFIKENYKAGAAILEPAYLINPKDDIIINFLAEANLSWGDWK